MTVEGKKAVIVPQNHELAVSPNARLRVEHHARPRGEDLGSLGRSQIHPVMRNPTPLSEGGSNLNPLQWPLKFPGSNFRPVRREVRIKETLLGILLSLPTREESLPLRKTGTTHPGSALENEKN